MYNLQEFLQDLSDSTRIKFALVDDNKGTIFNGDENLDVKSLTPMSVDLGKTNVNLYISCENEGCAALLKFIIENKYSDSVTEKQQVLSDILDGKKVSEDIIKENLGFVNRGCTLFVVNISANKHEALNILNEIYNDEAVVSVIYGDNIVVLGIFDEIDEHAESIRESIISDTYCKCSVSYGDIFYNINEIRKAYDDAVECSMLGFKFGIKNDIFSYNKMLFEKIVYSISLSVKDELLIKFKEKFDCFDKEIITTIEQFVSCGLNISDAARKLYIHRNTLIYRLDKINKETGFDIRNFREATVFIIAFLVWKENKTKR